MHETQVESVFGMKESECEERISCECLMMRRLLVFTNTPASAAMLTHTPLNSWWSYAEDSVDKS